MKASNRFILSALSLGLIAGLAAVPALAATEDSNNSYQTHMSRESSSPERFVRRIIIEGSLVNAGYEGPDAARYNQPNGFSAGALFDLAGNRNLVLETGVLYRQLGTTLQNGLTTNNSLTANYLSVPVSAKYYFSGQENNSLYIKGGVMGSTLLSNNTYYDATTTTQIGAQTWETALLGGLGYKFNLGANSDLLLEADYNRSLTSVFSNSSVYRSDIAGTLGFAVNL